MIHVDDFGRSLKISKDILKKIKKGTVSRVSVMIGFVDKSMHLELKKTKILFRLHLNLTEQVEYFSKDFKSMTFLRILFANKRKKSLIKEEIDRQLKEFKVMYNLKKVRLDGHQHVHFIPWIYKYLCSNPVCNIQELRYPVEPFHIVKLRFLFNRQFLRNIVAMTVLKIFSMFNKIELTITNIISSERQAAVEFDLRLLGPSDDISIPVTDIIEFDDDLKISSVRAYRGN